LLGKFSLLRIRRTDTACKGCSLCERPCPVKLPVATATVISSDCIGCLACVDTCPRHDALSVKLAPAWLDSYMLFASVSCTPRLLRRSPMRVNPLLVPGLFLGVLVGAILIAQLSGAWIVSGRTTIDTENLAVADIKGWMTLQQVIDGVHITREELYALVSIPADMPTTTALKDLEALVPGFETSTLRDALTAKLNSTKATPDAASHLPAQPLAQPSTQPSGQPSVQPTAHLTLTPTPRPSATPLPAGTASQRDQGQDDARRDQRSMCSPARCFAQGAKSRTRY
jgi:ferredoxin